MEPKSDQEKLLSALYTTGFQAVEDIALTLTNRWDIDSVSGPALDDIGIIVGQPRNGVSDDAFLCSESISLSNRRPN